MTYNVFSGTLNPAQSINYVLAFIDCRMYCSCLTIGFQFRGLVCCLMGLHRQLTRKASTTTIV